MRRTWAWVLGAGILGSVAGVPASADVPALPPPGRRPLAASLTVDFGPLAEGIGERYVVAPHDTLRSIARRYSADGAAWKALAAANRATLPDPDRLRVGDVLWVPHKSRLASPPPGRVVPAAAPAADYALFWVVPRGEKEVLRHGQGTKVPVDVAPGPFTLVLVPADSAAALLRLADRSERPLGSTATTPGAATASVEWPETLVPESDPAARLEVAVRVKSVQGSRLVVTTDVVRYDASGSVLAQAPPAPSAPPPAPGDLEGPRSIPIAGVQERPSRAGPVLPSAEGAPADEGRFPVSLAVVVALSGALVLGIAWFLRSRPAPPPEA